MARPTRGELLAKFFPDLITPGASFGVPQADRAAAVKINTLAAEAILADQIRLFDLGYQRLGPGVLINRLYQGSAESAFVPLEDLGADHASAEAAGDGATAAFLGELIDAIEDSNLEHCALIVLLDNSSAQLFRLDRQYPAKAIAAMLKEHA